MMELVFKAILNSVLTVFPRSLLPFNRYGKIQTIQNKNHTPAGAGSVSPSKLHPNYASSWMNKTTETPSVKVRWGQTPWEQILYEAPQKRAPEADFTDE